jgi:hypothetical protein
MWDAGTDTLSVCIKQLSCYTGYELIVGPIVFLKFFKFIT